MHFPFPVPDTNEFRQEIFLSETLSPGKYAVFCDDDGDIDCVNFEDIQSITQEGDTETTTFWIDIKDKAAAEFSYQVTGGGFFFVEIK